MTPEITTLPSGLRVATVAMPHLHSTSLSITVEAGAINEPGPLNGLAHLLEHMAFKGTPTRSARAIAEEVEAVGADINAYTGRTLTSYHMRSLAEHIGLGVDVIADLLCNSIFDDTELERERGVILQEIGAAEDTPDDIIYDLIQEVAFPDQPMGRPILGRAANLAAVGRDDLKSFMGTLYDAEHMVVSAAGKVNHRELVDLAAKYFGGLPLKRTAPEPVTPRYVGGEARDVKPLEQAHLVFCFAAPSMLADGYYETWLLSEILGGGMSSRLFQDIREERGLAYAVYSSYRAYGCAGLFYIYCGTGGETAQEAATRVAANLHEVAENVTEAELARAKAQVKAAILLGLEAPVSIADGLATDLLLLGRWVPPEETLARIDAITTAQVEAAAAALSTQPLSFAGIGPIAGLETYEQLAARFGTPAPGPRT